MIGDSAYIFGGRSGDGQLCSTNIHEVPLPSEKNKQHGEYASYQSTAVTHDAPSPISRYAHAACARDKSLIIHGGRDDAGPLQSESTYLWEWNTISHVWTRIGPPNGTTSAAPKSRYNHRIFHDAKNDYLILHGGRMNGDETESAETWIFDFASTAWTELKFAPALPLGSVFVNGTLYGITSESDWVQSLSITAEKATSAEWAINQTPSEGPARVPGAAVVLLDYGLGRSYLLQLLGTGESGIWSLQLPAGLASGARVKDVIRDALPKTDSGSLSWAHVEISPPSPDQEITESGKAHPGPRGYFGADNCGDGRRIILWGGINGKSETEGDGWILDFA